MTTLTTCAVAGCTSNVINGLSGLCARHHALTVSKENDKLKADRLPKQYPAEGYATAPKPYPLPPIGAAMAALYKEGVYPHARYDMLVDRTIDKIRELGVKKGGEYAGDDDRLANFRRNAAALGVNMETVWAVYAAKHWDAIQQFIKDKQAGKTRERMESLGGRADDLIVYLLLLKCMLDESGDL